ncbi:hypothetical protein EGW08_022923 [Elysia chlorotica]|uniref:Uncharacterized protein n=1 Tax=Elysia chlorotica TaxID=188477 RepID=A0A433SJS1_ELYCH|nr:hypothetical protein EGW08_022923 [Elysia chlorotica]
MTTDGSGVVGRRRRGTGASATPCICRPDATLMQDAANSKRELNVDLSWIGNSLDDKDSLEVCVLTTWPHDVTRSHAHLGAKCTGVQIKRNRREMRALGLATPQGDLINIDLVYGGRARRDLPRVDYSGMAAPQRRARGRRARRDFMDLDICQQHGSLEVWLSPPPVAVAPSPEPVPNRMDESPQQHGSLEVWLSPPPVAVAPSPPVAVAPSPEPVPNRMDESP